MEVTISSAPSAEMRFSTMENVGTNVPDSSEEHVDLPLTNKIKSLSGVSLMFIISTTMRVVCSVKNLKDRPNRNKNNCREHCFDVIRSDN